MWDSEVNPWNVADMGPKIDVMKEMAAEVKSRDLKFMATFHHGFHHMYYPKNQAIYLH
ncbi:MAG: alpha-L-fucosidase [Rikenellaceae bacterium]